MKTEAVEIDGIIYEVSEIGMDDGFAMLDDDGSLNAPAMIRAAVKLDGQAIEQNGISLRHAQKLLPMVLKLNGMEAGEEEGKD